MVQCIARISISRNNLFENLRRQYRQLDRPCSFCAEAPCVRALPRDNLVSMTRTKRTLSPPGRAKARRRAPLSRLPGHWLLQDAKARFSELVRRVRSEGPQHVTVHGRDEVVVVSAEEFRRLKGERSGDALIAAMQASPYRDIDIEPKRDRMPVRGIDL